MPTKKKVKELKRLRKEAGMTIPLIAEALHIHKSKISDLENGKGKLEPELIEKLKRRYKLIIQYNS